MLVHSAPHALNPAAAVPQPISPHGLHGSEYAHHGNARHRTRQQAAAHRIHFHDSQSSGELLQTLNTASMLPPSPHGSFSHNESPLQQASAYSTGPQSTRPTQLQQFHQSTAMVVPSSQRQFFQSMQSRNQSQGPGSKPPSTAQPHIVSNITTIAPPPSVLHHNATQSSMSELASDPAHHKQGRRVSPARNHVRRTQVAELNKMMYSSPDMASMESDKMASNNGIHGRFQGMAGTQPRDMGDTMGVNFPSIGRTRGQ